MRTVGAVIEGLYGCAGKLLFSCLRLRSERWIIEMFLAISCRDGG